MDKNWKEVTVYDPNKRVWYARSLKTIELQIDVLADNTYQIVIACGGYNLYVESGFDLPSLAQNAIEKKARELLEQDLKELGKR